MTNTLAFNPAALGALALNAAKHVYMLDKGPYGKGQYERLITLIEVLNVDYLASQQLDQPLRQVIELWRASEPLEKMGQLMLDYLAEYTIKTKRAARS